MPPGIETDYIHIFSETQIEPNHATDNSSSVLIGDDLEVQGTIYSNNIQPNTDNTYYLGKNDDDTPLAFKGIILKDQAGTGKYYRVEILNDTLQITDLTD